jgi:transcriptional regulator CtsR
LKEAGFSSDLGFDASILRLHWDLMKILVEEEAKILTSRVLGKVPAQDLPTMVEAGAAILNSILGQFHRKAIVETAKRYAIELRKGGGG